MILVAAEGFEPSRDCSQWILSPQCLPFHHAASVIIQMVGLVGFEPTLYRL